MADFEALPIRDRPESGPEARFPARKEGGGLFARLANSAGPERSVIGYEVRLFLCSSVCRWPRSGSLMTVVMLCCVKLGLIRYVHF